MFQGVFQAIEKKLEYAAFQEWQEKQTEYEDDLEIARKRRRQAKDKVDLEELPTKPKRRQAYVDDATIEALGEVLSENPRGVTWLKDELAGLIADMDKYSQSGKEGGTRSRLLSAYDGDEWKNNRTSNPARNIHIPHAHVPIFGGIQPAMLGKVLTAATARFRLSSASFWRGRPLCAVQAMLFLWQ